VTGDPPTARDAIAHVAFLAREEWLKSDRAAGAEDYIAEAILGWLRDLPLADLAVLLRDAGYDVIESVVYSASPTELEAEDVGFASLSEPLDGHEFPALTVVAAKDGS
jgi:hypothetical protein